MRLSRCSEGEGAAELMGQGAKDRRGQGAGALDFFAEQLSAALSSPDPQLLRPSVLSFELPARNSLNSQDPQFPSSLANSQAQNPEHQAPARRRIQAPRVEELRVLGAGRSVSGPQGAGGLRGWRTPQPSSPRCRTSGKRRADQLIEEEAPLMVKSLSRQASGSQVFVLSVVNEARARSLGGQVPRNPANAQLPSFPPRDAAAFRRGKEDLRSLNFDTLAFSRDDLSHLVLEIFLELDLVSRLGLDLANLETFVMGVRAHMFDNPYHNWAHVADATQAVYALGLKSGLIARLNDIERFALIVSVLCHDLEHPGYSNMDLVQHKMYKEEVYQHTTLEGHHAVKACNLLADDTIGLLRHLNSQDFVHLHETVTKNILATDMGRHKEYVDVVNGLIAQGPEPEVPKQMSMELLIKCADTSNVVRPMHVAKKWAVRVTDEFFKQGDAEAHHGFPVTAICNRDTQSRVGIQKGFIDFVIGPFFRNMGQVFPSLNGDLERVWQSRKEWDSMDDDSLCLRLVR